jgi:hypothetical protein
LAEVKPASGNAFLQQFESEIGLGQSGRQGKEVGGSAIGAGGREPEGDGNASGLTGRARTGAIRGTFHRGEGNLPMLDLQRNLAGLSHARQQASVKKNWLVAKCSILVPWSSLSVWFSAHWGGFPIRGD